VHPVTANPVFTRVPNTLLYLGPFARSALYLRGADPRTAPQALDVGAALDDYPRSIFVLSPVAIGTSETVRAAVAQRIATAFDSPLFDQTRVGWVADPIEGTVRVDAKIDMQRQSTGWRLVGQAQTLRMRNLDLELAADAEVEATQTTLAIAPAGHPHQLVFHDGRDGSRVATFSPAGAAILALLDADRAGGLWSLGSFDVSVAQAQVVDASVRYFTADPQFPVLARALVHPIFDTGAPGSTADTTLYTLTAQLDAWRLDDPERTAFALRSPAPLASHLRTVVGGAVALAPQASAALTLAGDLLMSPDAPAVSEPPVYFTPAGAFAAEAVDAVDAADAAPSGDAPRMDRALLAGTAAAEFFDLAAGGQRALVSFVPGRPAWAPVASAPSLSGAPIERAGDAAPPRFGALTDAARTSWVVLSGDAGGAVRYFAQPGSNALFGVVAGADGEIDDTFLGFVAPTAGEVTAGSDPFPLAPMSGVPAAQIADAVALGDQILSTWRRERIALPPPAAAAAAGEVRTSTTVQGFLVTLEGDDWREVDIAQSTVSGALAPTQLFHVRGDLQKALQTDQLFLTISSAGAFLAACDLPYTLDSELQFRILLNIDLVPADVVECLRSGLANQAWPVLGQAAFFALIRGVLTECGLQDPFEIYKDAIANVAVRFSVTAADWTFDLSPYLWATSGTILIFKFLPQALDELVADMASWTLPRAFNASPDDVQTQLLALIASAERDPDLRELHEIATDPAWTGVLALGVRTPLTTLPDQLKGLAAGIDPDAFKAAYVAIGVTPVDIEGGAMTPRPSSIGVLLDYRSPDYDPPQTLPQPGGGAPWDYTVLSLRVVIEASAITEFASQVALFSTRWFGDDAQLLGAAFVTLSGFLQKDGAEDTYLFLNTEQNTYRIFGAALVQLTADRIQFYTVQQQEDAAAEAVAVETRFVVHGVLGFARLGIDLLSFGESDGGGGGLRADGFALDMAFDITVPTQKEMAFDAGGVLADAAASQPRPGSLYASFPLALAALASGTGEDRPDQGGFMPVDVALTSNGLTGDWYGLIYELDLGTPGALAAQIGFVARVIVAWSPGGGEAPNLFLGLSLPGVKGGSRSLSLQGVIKLLFGTVGLAVSTDAGTGQTSYVLQLRQISLKILSLTLPSAASIDMFLFGDPSGADRRSVGWYASYQLATASIGGGVRQTRGALSSRPSNRLPRALLGKSAS